MIPPHDDVPQPDPRHVPVATDTRATPQPPPLAQSERPTTTRALLGALADFLLIYVGGGALAVLAWFAVFGRGGVQRPESDDPGVIGASLLGGFVIALLLAAMRLRRDGDTLAADWQRLRARVGLRWVGGVALMTVVANQVAGFAALRAGLDFAGAANQQALIAFAHAVPASLALLAIGVVMPWFEELAFRRLMYQRLLDASAPRLGAIAVSVAFVAMHAPLGSPLPLALFLCAVYGALSLLLCWVYARTRSLLAAFIVHALNNLAAVLLMLLD